MGFLLAGKDMAGGLILPDISPLNVLIEGFPVAVLGSSVVPHGSWKTPHGHYQKMVTAQNRNVIIGGRFPCRVGDLAGCGHPGGIGAARTGI